MNDRTMRRHAALALLAVTGTTAAQAAPKRTAATPSAAADARIVAYAAAPTWIAAPPVASAAPTPPGAPARIVYMDQQVRIGAQGQDTYTAWRLAILTPEALAAGNITLGWSPASQRVIVHRLTIIRAGKAIDVLATQKFDVIRRENNLEQAMLSGDLTATLQTAGVQVGDEIEFAATTIDRGAFPGDHAQGFMQFPLVGARGAYRLRVLQPTDAAIGYRASDNVPAASIVAAGAETEHRYELSDPASAIVPDGAPPRYAATRLVQFSGYRAWRDVSRTFAALYAGATTLAPASPVRAEAARIAAESADPVRRAETALRVVEDRIRYVYVGLDGGNYRPAAADVTWERRFGDCKAKTVLLVALLRELGIAAEPMLVNVGAGGDGIDERLPTPAVFDHVVVRATVAGRDYWLDGTRIGDRTLAALNAPRSRWALPLRLDGAALEPVPAAAPRVPQRIELVDLDASAGFDKPGKFRAQYTLRGDEIFSIRAQLAGLAAPDADRMQAAFWRTELPNVEPDRTTWRFDDAQRLLVLSMEGEGKVDWDGDDKGGHTFYLYGGGFPPPAEMKRPKDQPKDAPWALDYPNFTCYATRVKVPPAGKGLRWWGSSNPVDRVLGGVAYYRISDYRDGVMRIVKSRRVDVPEISAEEARKTNAAIKDFDNNKAYIFETKDAAPPPGVAKGDFGSFESFAGPAPPCQGVAKPE